MRITISKNLSPSQIKQITDLHQRILEESILNKFGKKFLMLLYQQIAKNKKDNIIIILTNKNDIIGFLVASTNSNNFYKQIISGGFWKLSAEIIKQITIHPKLFIETLVWSFLKSKKIDYPACLQFIAIENNYQGKGWGTKMMKQLNKEFTKRKIKRFHVGTKATNKKSNNFYKKLNFTLLSAEIILGEKSNYYLSPPIN